MTTFQIIMIIFWGIVYLVLSTVSIRDLIQGNFLIKKGVVNYVTAIWLSITVVIALVLTVLAFS